MAETGNWSPYYITDAGRALRQLSIAEGKQMVFIRAVIGTGKPADPATIDEMSGLVAFAKDVIIKRSYAIEANHLIIVRVDNSGYTQDVLMTEIGVYAKIDDQEDNQAILYGYAYSLDGYVLIPAQTSNTNRKIYEITLDTYLSRSSDIQIVFDSSTIFVSHADLDDAVESIDATIENLDASQIGLELEAFPGANTIAAAFTEVASQMANKANVASPAFTGTPTAPTAAAATNNTQIATTQFVQAAINAVLTPSTYATIELTGATAASGRLYYSRIGRLVHVFGSITSTVTTTSVSGTFSGLPVPMVPPMDIPVNYNGKFVQLRNDGGLRNYTQSSSTVCFNFTYIAAN